MTTLTYRQANDSDIAAMADIRAGDWGTTEFWQERIAGYLARQSHPRCAKPERSAFVCLQRTVVVGLIAGHLTTRFGCEGELQWISVRPAYRGRGVASGLFRCLAGWFVAQRASKICVDVEPGNSIARAFYRSVGARDFRPHWMLWDDVAEALAKPADAPRS